MANTATHHQGAIDMVWLHFRGEHFYIIIFSFSTVRGSEISS